MKANKFIKIRNFFINLMNNDYSDMNYFIKHGALLAISEKIKSGYKLDKKQEIALSEKMQANYKILQHVEEIIDTKLPDKYIYSVLLDNFNHIFFDNQHTVKDYPKLQHWMINQSNKNKAINFFYVWKQSIEQINETTTITEKKKIIDQFNIYKKYVKYLDNNEKNKLLHCLNILSKHTISTNTNISYYGNEINQYISFLKSNENNNESSNINIMSLNQLLCILKEQKEQKIYEAMKDLEEQYVAIYSENIYLEKNRKNNIIKLYEQYLKNNINDYLAIKKEGRSIKNGVKIPESLLLETIKEVKDIVDQVVIQINEDKLSTLSSKNEYFSQIRRQW